MRDDDNVCLAGIERELKKAADEARRGIDEGFDVATNFSIYELDSANGSFKVLREGWLDQNDVS